MPSQRADELADVITRFRRAEAALTSLVDGSNRLASVEETLEAARNDSRVLQQEIQALTESLAKEAEALSEAATALQRLDPNEMRRHLSQLAEATDRLRNRVDEVAGEQTVRLSSLRDDLQALEKALKPVRLHEGLLHLQNQLDSIRSDSEERWTILEKSLAGLQRDVSWTFRGTVGILVLLVAAAVLILVP